MLKRREIRNEFNLTNSVVSLLQFDKLFFFKFIVRLHRKNINSNFKFKFCRSVVPKLIWVVATPA